MDAPTIHPAEVLVSAKRRHGSSNLQALLVDCCKLQTLAGMQLAHEVMERVLVEKERRHNDNDGVRLCVPVDWWEKLLFGWVQLANREKIAMERMSDLMASMLAEAKADGALLLVVGQQGAEQHGTEDDTVQGTTIDADAPPVSQPTVDIFNTHLQGLAKAASLSPRAALHAEECIFAMKDFYDKQGWHTQPNARSYTHAISANANSWSKQAGDRAVAILRHVQAEHENQAVAYQNKYGVPYKKGSRFNKHRIVTTDATMYTVTMKAVIQSKSPPGLVVQLLGEATRAEVADRIHYNLGLKAMAKEIENTKNPRERLRIAQQAEELWSEVPEGASADQDDVASPLSTLNACLDVWSRAYVAEMGPRAETILQDVLSRGLVPDGVTFHTVIRAWSKSTKFHGAEALARVQATLEFQHALADQSAGQLPHPDYQTYALAILAYAGQKDTKSATESASSLLTAMQRAATEHRLTVSGNPCAPFAALLSVTAGAARRSAPQPKEEDPQAMLWSDGAGSTKLEDRKDEDPYDLARRIYQQVVMENNTDGLRPDHHFYAAFLRNVRAHGGPTNSVDRQTTAQQVWTQACEDGQVSRLVWSVAKDIIPKEAAAMDDHKLARYWWRNVEPRWR
jgi:hypothetical protein